VFFSFNKYLFIEFQKIHKQLKIGMRTQFMSTFSLSSPACKWLFKGHRSQHQLEAANEGEIKWKTVSGVVKKEYLQ